MSGWDAFGGACDATRVASGTNGVTSASGPFHAEGGTSAGNWGGYEGSFAPVALPASSPVGLATLVILLLVEILFVAVRR